MIQTSFTALSDPTRRAIIKLLREGSLTAGEVAEKFQQTKPTISHHLKLLKAAHIVRTERKGTSIVYTLQSNVLEDLAAEILDLADRTVKKKGVAR